MNSIRDHLTVLYGENTATQVAKDINGLCEKYASKLSGKQFDELSERDVLIIVYGDQVKGSNEQTRLDSLHQTLRNHLGDSVSHVHLLPFYPYSSDDGFSVKDYYAVNPDMGDWEAVERFSMDYHLMFDCVINHMSAQSDWFEKYLNDDPDFEDFFVDGNRFQHVEYVTRPRVSPLIHTYKNGKQVWTTFSEDQVDLNYQNPKVLLQVIDLMLFYITKGAALMRLDAVGFIWKKDGTTCIHLDETHTIIQLIREVLESCVKGVKLITETNVPHQENISYFGQGNEAHMVYNFALPPLLAFSLIKGTSKKLVDWAQSLKLPSENVCFFNFLASHDGVGVRPVTEILSESEINTLLEVATQAGGKVSYKANAHGKSPYEINCNYFDLIGEGSSDEQARKRMLLAHAILLAFPGLPAIYFHSLFGLHNDVEGMESKGHNRAINRQKFYQEEIEEKIKDTESDTFSVLDNIKKIIEVRKQYAAFDPYAAFEFPIMEDGLLAIIRKPKEDANQVISAYFNLSAEPKEILHTMASTDILSGKALPAGNFTLSSLAFKMLV